MKALDINILITLLCWGLWGIVDKKALDYARKEEVILRLYVVAAAIIPISFIALNLLYPGWKITPELCLWTGLASVSYTLSMFCYMAAMSGAEASFVLGITAAYPLIFQFLATVFLGEALVPQRLLGAAIIAVGLFLIGGSEKKSGQPVSEADSKKRNIVLLCIVMATFTWGVYGLFDKKAVSIAEPLEAYFVKALFDFATFFLIWPLIAMRKKIDWRQKEAWIYCSVSELLLAIGGLTYLGALAASTASYVISISGCYPLVMYLFAIVLLKEKFNSLRFAGIVLVVVGGLVVQLTEAL